MIIENLLTKNAFSRPCSKRVNTKALVIHWTANPMQGAKGVRDYFELRKDGNGGYGSAHYAIGLNGAVMRMIPDDEVAYHVGSSKIDPDSGKVYTDLAREKFGPYAIDHEHKSPNQCSIGIELCVIDGAGRMNPETIQSAIELSAQICKGYGLDPMADILLHKEVVGWKDCHKFYVNNPKEWEAFKKSVKGRI